MADFLSRLAARTIGTVDTVSGVRPLPISLFAPSSSAEGEIALEPAPAPGVGTTLVRPGPRAGAGLDSGSETVSPREARRTHVIPTSGSGSETASLGPHGRTKVVPTPGSDSGEPERTNVVPTTASPRDIHQAQSSHECFPFSRTEPISDEGAFQPRRIPAESAVRDNLERLPAMRPYVATALPEKPVPAAPTIRVNIGRIEVRAIMPQKEAPARPAATRPKPRLSLDDYLKQQGGRS